MKIKNVNPLGEVEDLLLGRVVAAGEVVEVTAEQAVDRVATSNYAPADKDAEKAVKDAMSAETREG